MICLPPSHRAQSVSVAGWSKPSILLNTAVQSCVNFSLHRLRFKRQFWMMKLKCDGVKKNAGLFYAVYIKWDEDHVLNGKYSHVTDLYLNKEYTNSRWLYTCGVKLHCPSLMSRESAYMCFWRFPELWETLMNFKPIRDQLTLYKSDSEFIILKIISRFTNNGKI